MFRSFQRIYRPYVHATVNTNISSKVINLSLNNLEAKEISSFRFMSRNISVTSFRSFGSEISDLEHDEGEESDILNIDLPELVSNFQNKLLIA